MQKNKLRFTITYLIALLTGLVLTGCQPTMFGMPQDQWNQLTPQQQAQVIDAYNQRKQTEAQNAPIMAAIGAASGVLKNKQSNDFANPGFNN